MNQEQFITEKIKSSFDAYKDYLIDVGFDTVVLIAYNTKTETCNTLISGKRDGLLTVTDDLVKTIINNKNYEK